eukprot:2341650-Prorocentrum_lima.AAC.1
MGHGEVGGPANPAGQRCTINLACAPAGICEPPGYRKDQSQAEATARSNAALQALWKHERALAP